MLRYLPIFVTLAALGTGSANAQQREAIFRKIEVPDANFDIVVATAKRDSPLLNYGGQPDPNVIYLGHDLVAGYSTELAELLDLTTLMHPVYSVAVEHGDKNGRIPVIIYIIPKSTAPAVAAVR